MGLSMSFDICPSSHCLINLPPAFKSEVCAAKMCFAGVVECKLDFLLAARRQQGFQRRRVRQHRVRRSPEVELRQPRRLHRRHRRRHSRRRSNWSV